MAPAFAEWNTIVFVYKKCKQCGKSESCSEEESELSESPQEACWMPTSKNDKGWAGSSGPTGTDFRMALQDGKSEAETSTHQNTVYHSNHSQE